MSRRHQCEIVTPAAASYQIPGAVQVVCGGVVRGVQVANDISPPTRSSLLRHAFVVVVARARLLLV